MATGRDRVSSELHGRVLAERVRPGGSSFSVSTLAAVIRAPNWLGTVLSEVREDADARLELDEVRDIAW